MTEAIRTSREGGAAILEIAHPPVNALAHAVRAGLIAALAQAHSDPAVTVIVLAGRGRASPPVPTSAN